MNSFQRVSPQYFFQTGVECLEGRRRQTLGHGNSMTNVNIMTLFRVQLTCSNGARRAGPTHRTTSRPTSEAEREYSSHGAPRYCSSLSSRQLERSQFLLVAGNITNSHRTGPRVTHQIIQPTPSALILARSAFKSLQIAPRPRTGPSNLTFLPGQEDKKRFPTPKLSMDPSIEVKGIGPDPYAPKGEESDMATSRRSWVVGKASGFPDRGSWGKI